MPHHRSRRPLLILLMLLPASAAAGQLYRCDAADGSTIYSARPCAEDAETVELEGSISSFGGASGNALLMRGSERTEFIRLLATHVRIGEIYYQSDEGLYVPTDGAALLVPFADLRSISIGRHPGELCGNAGQLCEVDVAVETVDGTYRVNYSVLRSVTVLIEDPLTDRERSLLVWFGDDGETNIRRITLVDPPPSED
jgi:uncharacterized protein DUF4124